MKLVATILVLCSAFGMPPEKGQDLDRLRSQYINAASDKSVCEDLMEYLRSQTHKTTTQWAYLGALESIWAMYVFNPLSKLNTFQKGKEKIEKSIASEPNNVEIRYLRLSIQKNIPFFLGYSEHIEVDKSFLKKNLSTISSEILKTMVENILRDESTPSGTNDSK